LILLVGPGKAAFPGKTAQLGVISRGVTLITQIVSVPISVQRQQPVFVKNSRPIKKSACAR
jgi:hypothetical protein